MYNRNIHNSEILIIELAGLGDSVVLAEFVESLMELNYKITVAVRKPVAEFWNIAFADCLSKITIIPIADNKAIDDEMYNYCLNNFHKEFEAVFAVSISNLTGFIASFAASNKKYALIEEGHYKKAYRLIFNKFHNSRFKEFYKYRYLSLFKFLVPDFQLKNRAYNNIASAAEKSITIHPGAKWLPRRWPLENFASLIVMLQNTNYRIKVVCGSNENDWFNYLKSNCSGKSTTFILTDSLSELISTIESTFIFLGNDSGPAHLANYFLRRTIVLWGPGNYDRIRPDGDNVMIIKKDIDCRPCRQYINGDICKRGSNLCLTSITPDEVFNTVESCLHK